MGKCGDSWPWKGYGSGFWCILESKPPWGHGMPISCSVLIYLLLHKKCPKNAWHRAQLGVKISNYTFGFKQDRFTQINHEFSLPFFKKATAFKNPTQHSVCIYYFSAIYYWFYGSNFHLNKTKCFEKTLMSLLDGVYLYELRWRKNNSIIRRNDLCYQCVCIPK